MSQEHPDLSTELFYLHRLVTQTHIFQIRADSKRMLLWTPDTDLDRLHVEPRYIPGKVKNLGRGTLMMETSIVKSF